MQKPAPHFWSDLTIAYLHDPPDKVLDIRTHVSRGRHYAEIAIGREISEHELKGAGSWADQRASEIERLPLPNAGQDYHRAVGVEDGQLTVCHPLSGEQRLISCPDLEKEELKKDILSLVDGINHPQGKYLSLWNKMPSLLEKRHKGYRHMPAETRVPDHTIWNHLDMTAGLYASYAQGEQLAFLSLVLGPVQPFIEAARSLRDLWTGSMLLSWLSFQSMIPILDQIGPTALVFPQLRGNPLMERWMQKEFGIQPQVSSDNLKSPGLPNRWVAVVPASQANALAISCKQQIKKAWGHISASVHDRLKKHFDALDPSWDRYWQGQLDAIFEVQTQCLPWQEYNDETLAAIYGHSSFETAFPDSQKIRDLGYSIPKDDAPFYEQGTSGRWQERVVLLGRLLESSRLVRPLPNYQPEGMVPPKCTLTGTFEQMGPAELSASAKFWEQACETITGWTRLRSGERLSAIALVKRFAADTFLLKELGLNRQDLGFLDTATLAARLWLKKYNLLAQWQNDWSGQWLHAPTKTIEEGLPPEVADEIRRNSQAESIPTYYAILVMDGDEMGHWLQGKKTPALKDVMHPKIRDYYRGIGQKQKLEAKRVVTPALHASISEALGNFSLQVVPHIVKKYEGELIYAGGDDVLALLPTQTALACAQEINQAFQGIREDGAPRGYTRINGNDLLMMGPCATLSAGLAIVHYKEDLRLALHTARAAEKKAKNAKRNALYMTACRHSGEWASSLCFWDELTWMQDWVDLFIKGLPNRWAYRLRQLVPDLQGFDELEPVMAELSRQINRLDKPGRELWLNWFNKNTDEKCNNLGQAVKKYFHEYAYQRKSRLPGPSPSDYLEKFCVLNQSLAFLARGRDE